MEGLTVILQFVVDKDQTWYKNSLWHYEIGMQMAKQNQKDKKGIRLRNMWHHTYFSWWITKQWDTESHWWACSAQITPYTEQDLTVDVRLSLRDEE